MFHAFKTIRRPTLARWLSASAALSLMLARPAAAAENALSEPTAPAAANTPAPNPAGAWVELFNGRNLEGWEPHSGKAEYRVEDGCIVGRTVAGTGNSFLCTRNTYGDFILEFEFLVPQEMNSGVQFRSEFFREATTREINGKMRKFAADRVHGYQYEIDPSARAYTGGIYDEARRGWMAELKNNEPARRAFKQGEWNHGRIECRGDHLQTWINDVKAADLHDGLTPRGIIALQVHSIGDGTQRKPGSEIRWRHLRLKEL